jgi:5-methylcytosine-specific restriction endonuclease McrBC GTP-binding regulatory subunit McrB
MNVSSKMRFSKFSNEIQTFSVKAYRKSEQKSQSNKTWISSSTEFVLQNIHFRSLNGILAFSIDLSLLLMENSHF